jgi:hypothetical protein
MKTLIDHRIHDHHQHAPLPADGPLEFTPEQTPDEVRAWLAKRRHDRDQAARAKSVVADGQGGAA